VKLYSKADGIKKVKSMKATGGAKVYKIKKVKTKVGGKNVTMYNLLTRNKTHSTGRNPFGLDMVKGAYLIPVVEGLNEQKTVEIGSAYDNNGEIELVIDKARRPDSWSTVNFDLTQSFYSGGGSSRETSLERQKKIKLKPSQINKIKKIIKNPEDKHYIENDNFRVSDILDALKRNK
tara:strand:- start:112 stop:642 length:531 start_codon:yes stop_codon:yes gene_type:complete